MRDSHGTPTLIRALSMHAEYACAHSGVCCRAGWTIPVAPAARAAIEAHLAAGQLARPAGRAGAFVAFDPDERDLVAFAHDESGACVFLAGDGSSLCAIHRSVGEAALPVACRQFPRVAVIGDGFTDLTLSHYCPTAAARLVDWTAPLHVAVDPACGRGRTIEGLDTRGHLPPLLRPGVLHSLGSWRQLESAAVALLDGPGGPEPHLATLDQWTRRIETWTPELGPLEPFVDAVVSGPGTAPGDGRDAMESLTDAGHGATALDAWRRAWRSVPAERAIAPPDGPAAPRVGAVRGDLRAWDGATGRYLAAKVLASWVPWLGTRTTTLASAVRLAYQVLLVEAAHHERALDRDALVEAIRRADLLLVHLANPPALVRVIEGHGRTA